MKGFYLVTLCSEYTTGLVYTSLAHSARYWCIIVMYQWIWICLDEDSNSLVVKKLPRPGENACSQVVYQIEGLTDKIIKKVYALGVPGS